MVLGCKIRLESGIKQINRIQFSSQLGVSCFAWSIELNAIDTRRTCVGFVLAGQPGDAKTTDGINT